jgi:YfiH family protein
MVMQHPDSPGADWLSPEWLSPEWPAPAAVRAFVTTRGAPLSAGAYGAFNTADHVGDAPDHVHASRQLLCDRFGFRYPPIWLDQVHGTDVVVATPGTLRQPADAVTTRVHGLPITIHTADCLPVFFCNRTGTQVAIAHAGWRGLEAGVIENTARTFADEPQDIFVWLGPAIGPSHFEVGHEVREAFLRQRPEHEAAFQPSTLQPDGRHWMCNIYLLARQRLASLGIAQVTGGGFCTVDEERFFSYRRDKVTGRMLSVMWLAPEA